MESWDYDIRIMIWEPGIWSAGSLSCYLDKAY